MIRLLHRLALNLSDRIRDREALAIKARIESARRPILHIGCGPEHFTPTVEPGRLVAPPARSAVSHAAAVLSEASRATLKARREAIHEALRAERGPL